jgi:sec-independent protein translocase protein TatA
MLSLIAWTPGMWELLIVAAVAFLFFGHRLPSVLKSLGYSIKSFKEGLQAGEAETEVVKVDARS